MAATDELANAELMCEQRQCHLENPFILTLTSHVYHNVHVHPICAGPSVVAVGLLSLSLDLRARALEQTRLARPYPNDGPR